ncbi:unnamed protein product [Pylaiella littoralis]
MAVPSADTKGVASQKQAWRKPKTCGRLAQGLASVLFCVVLAQGVAYPLGLDGAAALAMGIQVVAWVPSAVAQSEKFYDFTGMLAYMAVTIFSVLGFLRRFFDGEMSELLSLQEQDQQQQGTLPLLAMRNLLSVVAAEAPRHLVASALVLIWITRLGLFLFARIQRDGHDFRFDRVRDRPLGFLLFWAVQGMWVFFTPLPMLALHRIHPKGGVGSLHAQDAIGLAVWAAGFALEVVADNQKRAFKEDAANSAKFIDVGLWSRCRHPNYAGEMMIWTGFFIFCSRGVVEGVGWLTLISPVFVTALLVLISAPVLEERADKKYGGQAAYQEYKRKTPLLKFRLLSG